jgi:hypothetical protein
VKTVDSQARLQSDGVYFFLSHGHEPGDSAQDRDYWVSAVFQDLVREIDRRPRAQIGWRIGELRACNAAQREDVLRRALERARVFVALYSNGYLDDQQAMADRSAFAAAAKDSADLRILPVMWEPVRDGGAAELAASTAPPIAEYAESGLLALSRRKQTEDVYRRVLAFLGEWIIAVADGHPPPGELIRPVPPPRPRPAGGFLIARFAGSDSARLAAVAEHLAGLVDPDVHDVSVTEYVDRQQYAARPGLFLVDANLTGDAAAQLRAVLRLLPDWVVRVRVGTPPPQAADDLWRRFQVFGDAAGSARPRITEPPDPAAVAGRELIVMAVQRHETARRQHQRVRPFAPRIRILDADE